MSMTTKRKNSPQLFKITWCMKTSEEIRLMTVGLLFVYSLYCISVAVGKKRHMVNNHLFIYKMLSYLLIDGASEEFQSSVFFFGNSQMNSLNLAFVIISNLVISYQ